MSTAKKKLDAAAQKNILDVLKKRFEKNMSRHQSLDWTKVQAKLEASPDKLWSLSHMEDSGGEPDVVGFDKKDGKFTFIDCSAESPKGRRSFCYDRKALDSRKEHKPD